MCKEFEDIANEVLAKPGYTYSDLKDILDDYESGVIAGMCSAINSLRNIDPEEQTDDSGSETLNKILIEMAMTDIDVCVDAILYDMAAAYISFGDNHPED